MKRRSRIISVGIAYPYSGKEMKQTITFGETIKAKALLKKCGNNILSFQTLLAFIEMPHAISRQDGMVR